MIKQTKLLVNWITIITSLISLYVATYAIRLLVIGEKRTTVIETPMTEGASQLPNIDTLEYIPYPVALIPLLASLLLLCGLLIKKLPIAWIGMTILSGFSLLFLFSSGAALLPWVAILLCLLVLNQYFRRKFIQIN